LSLAILSPVLGYFGTIDFLFIITKKKVSHISLKDRADIDLYKRMFVILTRWISNKKTHKRQKYSAQHSLAIENTMIAAYIISLKWHWCCNSTIKK
jgi:hypothetical protein